MSGLEEKVALISGGSRGMGAATAREMVRAGARVVIGDVLDEAGRALAAELGSSVTYVHLDVTSEADWDAAVAATTAAYGRLNVLVNNAGILRNAPIEEHSKADWDAVLAVNLTGVFNGMRAAIPALREAGGGSIINVSSAVGLRGYPAAPAYVAAKFGVRGLTKAAALDLGRYGIRVNSIHPGLIRTPMVGEDETQFDVSGFALNRVGEPVEVARLTVYLASDDASYSTGAEFIVDGGETAGHAAAP